MRLTNTIKTNSRRFLQGLSKQDRLTKVPMILKRMFDKSHEAKYDRPYDARAEVELIMKQLKIIKMEEIKAYEEKIISLVNKMKDKLVGFNGTTQQNRAKVYNELEELRHLFIIPYNDFIDNEIVVESGGTPNTQVTDNNLYHFYRSHGALTQQMILSELPSVFPPGTVLMGGRHKKKTHTKKSHVKKYN